MEGEQHCQAGVELSQGGTLHEGLEGGGYCRQGEKLLLCRAITIRQKVIVFLKEHLFSLFISYFTVGGFHLV